ncbi:alpha/beta fold hydrolase [Streptomyces tauricus]|uniref:Alpha/beta fold hydrolase n=1 Tax=Streptomyces tauricus TaxID=68274 RepID=A0ABZ1J8Q1_9ACTN|nr:alpha/beta fold hydrolase [Streptomyces tauricus]
MSVATYRLGDLSLESGEILRDAQITYAMHGQLAPDRRNVVLCPTFFGGDHTGYDWLIGSGRPLDTDRYCVVVPGLFGNGFSSSPSNHPSGSRFPAISSRDNVVAQHRLVTEELGAAELALVTGWSMGAMHAYQWAVSYPQLVARLAPICGSATTSEATRVFLSALGSALRGDGPAKRRLRAAARVFAGWAASHEFWAERLYRELGFVDRDAYLTGFWDAFFTSRDVDDLLVMVSTWERSDVGATRGYGGSVRTALEAVRADTVLLPGLRDQCFAPQDEAATARIVPSFTLSVIPGVWGHLAGSGATAADRDFVAGALGRLLERTRAVAERP